MRKIIWLTALIIIACAPSPISIKRHNLLKLQIGMDKEEVISVMGNPYKNEAFSTPGGGHT